MTTYDQFIQQQLAPRLDPGETIVATGFLFNKSLTWMLLGGMLTMLGGGYFDAALTRRRLILIHTRLGFASAKMVNEGITEIPLAEVASVQLGGMMHLRSVRIVMRNGVVMPYRLNTLSRFTSGQRTFLDTLAAMQQSGGAAIMPGMLNLAPTAVPVPMANGAPQVAGAAAGNGAKQGWSAIPGGMSVVDQLKELAVLHQSGVLTDAEYAVSKTELLKRM
jgi:hypothetical protein